MPTGIADKRQRVAGLDVGVDARHHDIANLQALRVQDVALLAVHIVEQGDACGAVRVVLDGCNLGGHAVFVALEVDDTVTALVAATLMTSGDATVVVAACLLRQGRKKRLLRLAAGDFGEVRNRLEAATGAGRLVLLDSHQTTFLPWSPARVPLLAAHQALPLHSWKRLPNGLFLGVCSLDSVSTRPGVSIHLRTQLLDYNPGRQGLQESICRL